MVSNSVDTHCVARPVMSGVFGLSLLFIVVGARGFTRRGLPLTAKKRIAGGRGIVIGTLCLLVGILGISLAFWASTPAAQQSMRLLCYGIVVGILGTLLVLVGPRFEAD
jgi:hypothetical protein